MSPLWLHFLVASVSLATLALGVPSGPASASPSKLLDVPYLRVNARMMRANGPKDGFERVQTYEFYSNVERRSRIELSNPRTNKRSVRFGDTYFRDELGTTLRASLYDAEQSCAASSAGELVADLLGTSAKGLANMDFWLDQLPGVPDHVVGLARLLVFVDANRDKLQARLASRGTRIRNQETDFYAMTVPQWGPARDVSLSVYLGANGFVLGDAQLPLRISVSFTTDFMFFVEYSRIERLYGELGQTDMMNLFSFPVGLGCSAEIKAATRGRATATQPIKQAGEKVVSMHVRISDLWLDGANMRSKPQLYGRHFVAFDAHQQVSRFDSLRVDGETGEAEYSVTIHDLKAAKRYNIKQTLNKDDLQHLPSDLKTSNLRYAKVDFDGPRECAVAEAQHIDYEHFLPYEELVYMGAALVRGTKVQVFEATSRDFPQLIFQHVSYRDSENLQRTTFDKSTRDTKVFVYYFSLEVDGDETNTANQKRPLGSLMRVDVLFDRKVRFRAEVINFMRQLTDAPNGDRQQELFSLADHCSDGDDSRADRSSRLTMELDYVDELQQSELSLDTVQELIGNPLVRNKALERGLSLLGKADITATKLHELESRMRLLRRPDGNESDQLKVFVTAKVADIHDQVYRATVIATGKVQPGVVPTSVDNLAECYWAAAHKRTLGPVLFAYTNWFCFIDTHASGLEHQADAKTPGNNQTAPTSLSSNMFDLSFKAEFPIEVMQFEQRHDKRANLKVSRWAVYSDLLNQVLQIPILSQQDSGRVRTSYLQFNVARVELTNKDWPLDGAFDEEEVLNGLSLVDGELVNLNLPDKQQADVGACHSACMSNLECKSFSVCISGRGVECRLSLTLRFRDEKLLQLIKEAADPYKSSNQVKVIELSQGVESANGAGEDEVDDEYSEAEVPKQETRFFLKVDRRCTIHNKRVLDLFNEMPKSLTSLSNRKSFLHVENVEECAEHCLGKNLKYLEKTSKLHLKGSSEYARGEVDKNLAKVRQTFIANHKYWCATFKYLNLATNSISKQLLKLDKLHGVDRGGICLLTRPQVTPPKSPGVMANSNLFLAQPELSADSKLIDIIKFRMDTYEFDYKYLYSAHSSIRLLDKPSLPTNSSDVGATDDELVRGKEPAQRLINEQRMVETKNVEFCAQTCFTQAIPMVPYCKSFDFVEAKADLNPNDKVSPMRRYRTIYYCVFNSVTLEESRRLEPSLVGSQTDRPNVKVRHYEPRRELMMLGQLRRDLAQEESAARLRFQLEANFSLALISVLAILAGVALGSVLKRPVARHLFPEVRGTRSPSVISTNNLISGGGGGLRRGNAMIEAPIITNVADDAEWPRSVLAT